MIRTLKNKLNKVVNKDSYYKKYLENNVGTGYNLKLIGRNYETGKFFPEYEDKIHLKETINWLKKGQDVCNGNGVSSLFCPIKGWGVAYPETSGYIIPTFLAISELINDDELFKRAVKLGDWEIEIQTNSGGVLSNPLKSFTRIFNTGQVILGWCVLYEKTNENKYLNAALRAAEYLLINQEYDGQWNKNTYCGSRTYHSRVDWALLRLGLLSNDKRFIMCAQNNLKWVLNQQNYNGWFENCGFEDNMPIMHVISYTIRGLLECYDLDIDSVNQFNILPKIKRVIDILCEKVNEKSIGNNKGLLPSSFQNNWISNDNHSCLTGNAQFAIILYRLTQITGNKKYSEIANIIVKALKRTQVIDSNYPTISGAISGSYPIFSGYMENTFPNWASKFFADALIMKNNPKIIIKA